MRPAASSPAGQLKVKAARGIRAETTILLSVRHDVPLVPLCKMLSTLRNANHAPGQRFVATMRPMMRSEHHQIAPAQAVRPQQSGLSALLDVTEVDQQACFLSKNEAEVIVDTRHSCADFCESYLVLLGNRG